MVLSFQWESVYLKKTVFILKRAPGCFIFQAVPTTVLSTPIQPSSTSLRYAFRPNRLKPTIRALIVEPAMALGGQSTAGRLVSQQLTEWANLSRYQASLDRMLADLPCVHMFVTAVTTVFTRTDNPTVYPAIGIWILANDVQDILMLNTMLPTWLPQMEYKSIHGQSTSDMTEQAHRCLLMVLKDHNNPWVLEQLLHMGTKMDRPVVHIGVTKPDLRAKIAEAVEGLSGQLNIALLDTKWISRMIPWQKYQTLEQNIVIVKCYHNNAVGSPWTLGIWPRSETLNDLCDRWFCIGFWFM